MMHFKLVSALAFVFGFTVMATTAASAQTRQVFNLSSTPKAASLLAQAQCRTYNNINVNINVCVDQYVRFYDRDSRSFISGRVSSFTDSMMYVQLEGTTTFWPYFHRAIRDVGFYALKQNEPLRKGSQLVSPNGCYRLVLQDDGNLVTYDSNGAPLWRTGRRWGGGGYAMLQADSNFVVYAGNRPVWSSNSYRRGGSRLVIQDDSNVVMLTPGGRPVWDSGTGGRRCNR